MTETTRTLLRRADLSSLQANKKLDARAALWPSSIQRKTADPLLNALNSVFEKRQSPLDAVRATRLKGKSELTEGRALLRAAKSRATEWKKAADYIRHGGELPDLEGDIVASLGLIRAAKAAGVNVAGSLANRIDDEAERALTEVKRLSQIIEVRQMAADVALAKKAASYLNDQAELNPAKAAIFTRSAARFEKAERQARARHKVAKGL